MKYKKIKKEKEKIKKKSKKEKIRNENSIFEHKNNKKKKIKKEADMKNHEDAVKIVINNLLDENFGVINDIKEIDAVGHRVLHGGKYFSEPVLIDQKVKDAIRDCFILGPLHNPSNLIGIETCEKLMPNIKQVAVFDTAFHQTMPEKAFIYALPYEYYKENNIRRYGFHGTSHKFVAMRVSEILKNNNLKLITCHLGNGSSVCAIKNNKCVDTSMGLTPLEGLAMGTRCGDLDPAIIKFLAHQKNLNIDEIDEILNKKSGVLGISQVSSDFRDMEKEAQNNNYQAKLALEIFYYRCAKYIGAYVAALNGVDVIVFTAGLGENSPETREAICNYLNYLGVEVDKEKNNSRGKEIEISSQNSRVKVFVVPTNEELMIARETLDLIK